MVIFLPIGNLGSHDCFVGDEAFSIRVLPSSSNVEVKYFIKLALDA